jgi:hypothetical protein
MDWGRLYSFGFDVDAAPVASAVSLAALEPGAPDRFAISAPAPAPEPDARLLVLAALTALAFLRRYGRPRSRA